ncbi:4-(cytidine 5'-diphospho)-2-C-methyl-D-erythritol kinase [Pseudoclavibacter caeni]|jgi:4-diphosphocytidyl-2-C-methyl-D-erythritol kinase|uniref:4-diphosphocytidyl-2-C-methyl-D-erythritol kinase n=1 Tax=Pseudoclavibacter caeni TaxID=908846 RepID=A0A7C8BTB9_9MICO|nr:4-(cytidine 5'-diphospho)-2-C-methyl-D-erythritol kinase [Pseudoclavibacter caeni]KAB1631228.1 4-(cytidine 5'-diphospho)-2-C-methyl-D-erythritol kinase [Pseudoclavibacter caeni]NYJ96681.1 4-diphosphocytidyl-2-C-methyl-D-erythritol kinase [Pseudoclavibacter caeni]
MHPAAQQITTRTPGKINLLLAVGARGADGYHPLVTVFHAVGVHEDVTVARAAEWRLAITGPRRLPPDDDNLALRAGRLLASRADPWRTAATPRTLAASITLRKRVPVGGGMAGGSADAAGALVALARLWRLDVTRQQLVDLAGELGADVPFGISGGVAIGTGRGDRLTQVIARRTFHWVLVPDAEPLSTPAVYARFDEMVADGAITPTTREAALARVERVVTALSAGDAAALAASLGNDLQEPALTLRPRLQQVLDLGAELGAAGAIVSGSGPTVALLARDAHHAAGLSQSLLARGHETIVTTSSHRGAHVLP